MHQLKDFCTTPVLPRMLIGAALMTALAACGGGDGQGGAGSQSQLAASLQTNGADGAANQAGASPILAASTTSVTTWTQCATENATCNFSGSKQVRYGANGIYVTKTLTGPVSCSNNTFGDPVPGADKTCDVATATSAPAVTWTDCAKEYGTCSVPGTRQVRYGANGKFAYKTVTTSVVCNNGVFGDPAVGTPKSCSYSSETSSGTTPPSTPTNPTSPSQPANNVLPVPTNIANGSTVNLECGKTYQGTLALNGKSNVTVTTSGSCGKATITPGSPVTGWTKYSGNIYSAAVGFAPVQMAISGAPASLAHWPNSGWSSSTPPNSDLNGANLVYLDNQSVIASQAISGSSVSTAKPFYVEGKLWMLDSANEWAYANGRVYVWAADGQSPEGRAWASPNANAVNADKSSGVTLNNIRLFAATNGVSADTSTGLKVLNTDIANVEKDGIWASGSQKLTVDASTVTNARSSGIDGWYSITGAIVTNTTVSNTGAVNQSTPTGAGIFFGDGSGNRIENVRVLNSSYHGISVLHNSNTQVLNSVVDNACSRLTDCGGIYTGARDQKPLSLTISGNTVTNVKGTEGIAIYLDDFANGVTVTGNTMRSNTRALVVHNGFNNVINKNTFDSSAVTHLGFVQDSGNVRNNQVSGNTFKTTGTEWTYNLETGSNLKTFASFDGNIYTSVDPNNFGRTWDGKSNGVTTSFTAWKAWLGGDQSSTMNGRQ